jgi:tRNA G37 N-methylase Trm5
MREDKKIAYMEAIYREAEENILKGKNAEELKSWVRQEVSNELNKYTFPSQPSHLFTILNGALIGVLIGIIIILLEKL